MYELASVKYIGADNRQVHPMPYGYKKVLEREDDHIKYFLYENQYPLPLGYAYDHVISDKEAEKYSAAEKQELTLTTAIVDDENMEKDGNIPVDTKPDFTVHKLPIKETELHNVTMKDGLITIGEGGGSITFHFDGEDNAETYLSFHGDIVFPEDGAEHFNNCTFKAEGTDYFYKFRVDAYNTGQDEYLFNLGYHKDAINTFSLSFQSPGTLTYDDISIYSQPMTKYPDRIASLKEESLENVKAEKNTVTGNISLKKDKMLVITLPYQSGWTAYVDGKETELQRANYQYMALNLKAGNHKIRLHYHIPGLKISLYCTAAGVFLFILIILFNYIRKKRRPSA